MSAAPKVLVCLHDHSLNGATISILRAAKVLEEDGWRFAYWAPRPGPAYDQLEGEGADVAGAWRPIVSGLRPLRLPPGPARRLASTPGYLRAFSAFLRSTRPDVVHANSLFSFAEAMTSRALGYRTVLQLHDMAPTSWKARPAGVISRRFVSHAIAVSQACARSYAYDGWSPAVVYGGAPVRRSPFEVRSSPSPFAVGTVGVISRRKATDVFVEAAASLLAEGAPISFHLIGAPDDPLDREWAAPVIRRARDLGITYQERADVMSAMESWDAFVLPSRIDPFPIVMLEAMSSGLPVIGAQTGGIPEQVSPACGRLVSPDDPRALARAIRELADEPGPVRAEMGAQGRARVQAHFTVERQAEALAETYRGLVGPARGT